MFIAFRPRWSGIFILGVVAASMQSVFAAAPQLARIQQLQPDPSEAIEEPFGTPANLEFGRAVALRGDIALVGMPALDGVGRVAVFTRGATGAWNRTASLSVPGAVDFGRSMTLRDNIAVIGAAGAAYVFRRSVDGAWLRTQKLSPAAADGVVGFGFSVRYQDQTIAAGALLSEGRGVVYIFEITSAGKLRRTLKISPSDRAQADAFGDDIGMTHDTLVIGAPGISQGAAYVFKRSGDRWVEHQKLIAIDGEDDDRFGDAVAIDRGMIVVGAPAADREGEQHGPPGASGAAYVFTLQNGLWHERLKLRPAADQEFYFGGFGEHAAMFDRRIVITARQHPAVDETPYGLAFAYQRDGANVTELGLAGGLDSSLLRITSIGISGLILLTGSPFGDSASPFGHVGAAALYSLRPPAD